MGAVDYGCNKCGWKDEFFENGTFHDPVPEKCPSCGSEIEKLFTATRYEFGISGWSPDNEHGKKNWRKRMSTIEQAAVLDGSLQPY